MEAADKYGITPLCVAALDGHERVVRVLIERSNANLNTTDNRQCPQRPCGAHTGPCGGTAKSPG